MAMNKAACLGSIKSKKTPAHLKAGLVKYARKQGWVK
jgi:hypothetical protein